MVAGLISRLTNQTKEMWHRTLVVLAFLILCLFIIINFFLARDFGFQWDEWTSMNPAVKFVKTGKFLPGTYLYPSFCYDLALVGLVYDVVKYILSAPSELSLGQFLEANIQTPDFHLRTRFLFALFSSLTIVWTGLLVKLWKKSLTEALFVSAALGLSWEVFYHSLWIVPNTIMMQWAALTILLLYLFHTRRAIRWLYLSSGCAGLATGTKYQCGMLLLPIYLEIAQSYLPGGQKLPNSIRHSFMVALIFGVTYLITTPGTLLESDVFLSDLRTAITVYRNGHVGHTVSLGWEHFYLTIQYFAVALFSWYSSISMFLFSLCLIGSFRVGRDLRWAIVFLSFPAVYIAYFVFTQRVLHVRNLMVLVPFLAVLAGNGWQLVNSFIARKIRRPFVGRLFNLFVLGAFLINAQWIMYSTQTIQSRQSTDYLAQLIDYIKANPDKKFLLSKEAQTKLKERNALSMLSNFTSDIHDAPDLAVLYTYEVDWTRWKCNTPDYFVTWFGPYELNLNYYPTWNGQRNVKILVMLPEKTQSLGIF